MYQTIKENWLSTFITQLKGTDEVRIISPFINQVMVNHLLENINADSHIKVITRYCLSDFLSGVSSLSALRSLVKGGAQVKGIKGLHSKVYLFDHKSVILTSANFTSGGFFNNHEFGVLSDDALTINESIAYFESLATKDDELLDLETIERWQLEISQARDTQTESPALSDYGKKSVPLLNKKRNYFIKFFGSDGDRVNPDYMIRDMIEHSHCHYALTFSGKKGRPRKYRDGDIVYLARMLNGRDYAMFGFAIAIRHDDVRDMATAEDIAEISWREDWPVYVRIHTPIFVDGCMGDCPTMSRLISELQHESFDKTQKRFNDDNTVFINPWNSLIRQADVQLSELAAQWLDQELNLSINRVGTVPEAFMSKLYAPLLETQAS